MMPVAPPLTGHHFFLCKCQGPRRTQLQPRPRGSLRPAPAQFLQCGCYSCVSEWMSSHGVAWHLLMGQGKARAAGVRGNGTVDSEVDS